MIDAELTLTGANLISMNGQDDCGVIQNAAISIADGSIVWIGESALVPDQVQSTHSVNLDGKFVSPGLIDCHSHLIFGGNRADEWQERIAGASYAQIARRGGGIKSTVRATRAASDDELFDSAKKRIEFLIAQGVTTFEIKSGYGLDVETELRMLSVATRLRDSLPVDIYRTFLGAHTVPAEYQDRAEDYIDLVCTEMLPAVRSHCDAVDIFCENIAFDLRQTERVLVAAKDLELPIKIHAEQLSLSGGAKLAAEMGAVSADHLEYLDNLGVKAMAKSGTVAVLLPGAFYFIGETKKPPVNLLREHQVPIAIATDFNPGSSPAASLLLMMNMACTLFGLTVEEALCATTCNAARALRRDEIGSLEIGKQADLVVWDIQSVAEIPYGVGHNPCQQVYKRGKLIYQRS